MSTASTLTARAEREIKRRLIRGQLDASTGLSERQLAAELGMSKTPVREALSRLASDGLVSITPQRGVVVNTPGVDQLADCFELREVLEPYILRRLAGRLTAAQVAELRRQLRGLRDASRRRDTPEFVRLDLELHATFARFLGNGEIGRVIEQMRDRISLSIVAVIKQNPDRLRLGNGEHVRIVKALIDGDGDRAAELMLEHLRSGKQSLYPRNL
jgi:GntR family transcriptional regulator, rspAB operon transcriptional repressor